MQNKNLKNKQKNAGELNQRQANVNYTDDGLTAVEIEEINNNREKEERKTTTYQIRQTNIEI